MLHQRPHMKTVELRPFLRKFIPGYQQADGKHVGNFKKKVFKWIAINGTRELTSDEAMQLASKSTANESIPGDSSISSQHLQHILTEMMLHIGCVWEVMNPFCKMKHKDANFC